MVLDQFQTIYRKDYVWPYVRAYGLQPLVANPDNREEFCKCQCPKPEPPPSSEPADLAWSRLGPMGPLLDPKVYPARVGWSPESEISRFNQPNVFLAKLKEKYPYIYECLKNAPPDDLVSRINRNRLRTTYQVDYCRMQEYPDAPYDELLRGAGVDGTPPCPEPIRLPGDPCRPNQKSIAFRPALITNRVGGGKNCAGSGDGGQMGGGGGGGRGDDPSSNKYCVGSCRGPLGTLTSGATEYQDAISRLGQLIMRDKIHYAPKKKSY